MRSLALKLTLAFLFIGLTVAGLVAFFIAQQTQREFDRFVLNRHQAEILNELIEYYQVNGSWDNLNAVLVARRQHAPGRYRRGWNPVTIVDADNIVVVGGTLYRPGERLSGNSLRNVLPIEIEGEVVGKVVFQEPANRAGVPLNAPEFAFINAVRRAILYSVSGAIITALLLGILLARTISRPIRELTQATHLVAQGDLGHEVPVRTRDEIGELATSFNRMSTNLAEANQLRRQMTADIAHDLRTPTSVIMGYTEALNDGKLSGTSEIYQIMHKEAQHLSHLIDDLRILSLADAGELPLTPQPVSPLALLEDAAASHNIQAHSKGIRLDIKASPTLPLIHIDPDRMNQVLGNLLSNALRYTPADGLITLSAEQNQKQVLLRVCDTGVGIPTDDLPYVFHRFYRSDRSRSQSGESGLGLAIARSIVEAHGGTIRVSSVPDRGTTFTISLPAL